MVLKRHWLEAEIMPYVLRYVGVATLTDPALAATIAGSSYDRVGIRVNFGLMALIAGSPPLDVPPQDLVDRLTQELDCRLPDNDLVCIACGCGDCTVGHWVRWCIVPIVAAHRLLASTLHWALG